MPIEFLTYRSRPILKITSPEDERIKIQFGLKKANLIISELEAIKSFITLNTVNIDNNLINSPLQPQGSTIIQ